MTPWRRATALALGAALLASTPAGADAVFVVTLNLNYYQDQTADRVPPAIRRHAALVQRYGIRSDYSFTWLASRMVAERDPTLFAFLEASGMAIGHHGANRPPDPEPVARVAGLGWDEAVAAMREYESHDVDPSTGALLPGLGGLAGMKALYGLDLFSTGRFVKAPILFVAREHGVRMMVGLRSNVGAPSAQAWYMGGLNRPEEPDLTIEPDQYDPKEPGLLERTLATLATRLDDSGDETRFGALLIHDSELVGGSVGNMRSSGASEARNEAWWANYERILAYLVSRGDVRFASMPEILEATAPDLAPTLGASEVSAVAAALKAGPGLPLAVDAGGRWVTLAEALVALETAVAAGTVPASVATASVLGPRADAPASGAALTLARADLTRAASSAAGRDAGFVRSTVTVGGRSVNAAEYLLALAALVAEGFPSQVRVEAHGLSPEAVSGVRDTLTRLQFWSYKPARIGLRGAGV